MHLLFFLQLFFYSVLSAQNCIEVRAAFDIGSGSTRMSVAEVDVCKQKIIKILLEDKRKVSYKEDLEKDQSSCFSPSVTQAGLSALQELKVLAESYKPQKYLAVATSSCRESKNAADFVQLIQDKLGIQVEVISPEREGILGFKGALAKIDERAEDIVVWDIGGGSKELTVMRNNKYLVYSDEFASVGYKNLLIQKLKDSTTDTIKTPNPIGIENFELAVDLAKQQFRSIPVEWEEIFVQDNKTIIGIGGVHNYSVLGQLKSKHSRYHILELKKVLLKKLKQSDLEIGGSYASTEVSNLLYVYSMMDYFGIKEVQVVSVNLTEGLLISR